MPPRSALPLLPSASRPLALALLLALALAGCATTPPPPPPPDPAKIAAERAAAEAARAQAEAEARAAAARVAAREAALRDPAQPLPDGLYAEFGTPRGTVVAELYFEKMPLTVTNFVGLAEGTLGPVPRKPFFDGVTFHRVVPGFVIQGGDPTGSGRGDPGYKFPDEFAGGLRHDLPGLLSMANSGPDTNGSQFFITLGAARYLDFNHAIFGRVVRGADVPEKIQRGDAMTVKILRVGGAAQTFRADEAAFAERLARNPRRAPAHLEDRTGFAAGAGAPPPWQAKYLENRLANLARFTGRHVYVRFLDAFAPETADQTAEQFAAALLAKLHAPAGSLLALYLAGDDRWVTAGTPPDFKRPVLTRPPLPPGAQAPQRQAHMYSSAEEVVSSLIDQTDPK